MSHLTYHEFKHASEQLGYDVDLHYNHHQVAIFAQDLGAVMGGNTTIATVDKKKQYWFSMFDFEETPLKLEDWNTIQSLCSQLAITPIDKRSDQKAWTLANAQNNLAKVKKELEIEITNLKKKILRKTY